MPPRGNGSTSAGENSSQGLNLAVVIERIDRLTDAIAQLDSSMAAHMEQDRKNREAYLVDHAVVEQSTRAAHSRLDKLEPVVDELRRAVQANATQTAAISQRLGLLVAIVSPIGLGVVVWLVEQLLGLIKP